MAITRKRLNFILSPRQIECLKLVSNGNTSAEIADILDISPRTVDQYIADACARLGARNRTQAVAKAINLGLIADTPSVI